MDRSATQDSASNRSRSNTPFFDAQESISDVLTEPSPSWLSVQAVESLIRATAGIPVRAFVEMRGAVDHTVNLVTAARISAEAARISAQMMSTIDGARTALLGALAFERLAPVVSHMGQALSSDPMAQQALDWFEEKLNQIRLAQEALAQDVENHLPENRELIEAIKMAGLAVGRLLCSVYHLCSEAFTRANIIEACKMIVTYANMLDQRIGHIRASEPQEQLQQLLERANAAAQWLSSEQGRAFSAEIEQKMVQALEHAAHAVQHNRGDVEAIIADLTADVVHHSIQEFSQEKSEWILDATIESFKDAIHKLPPNTKRDLIHRGMDVGRLRTALIKRLIASHSQDKVA